jgi:S-adenosylmethionine decarboxylase
MAYFGPHLLLDLRKCNKEKLASKKLVYDILLSLPEKIGTTRISEPSVFYYSGNNPEDQGVTGIVVLAESHCSIHTFQEKGYCFVDIFSCKKFDVDKALDELVSLFQSQDYKARVVERGADFPR